MGIDFILDSNGVRITSDTEKYKNEVKLSPEEAQAVNAVVQGCTSEGIEAHCERRTDSYLSIVGETYGEDFCRIKVSQRACWFSVDMPAQYTNDERFTSVKNRNVRHWKISLTSISDIEKYIDIIVASAKENRQRAKGFCENG